MTQETTSAVHELAGVRESIRKIVAEELELELAELSDTADFIEEYDADSLSLITVVARIEKELEITVPRDVLDTLTNLERIFAVIDKTAAEPAGD